MLRTTLTQLTRIRWGVRVGLGVAVSVIANVLHALDNPISQAIAAWPPLALLLTVELISRVPVHRRSLAFARLFATATIAGIAAWVSYWHMAGVAARYGETGAAPYLIPASVDGLIVMASVCLVELGGRIQTSSTATFQTRPGAASPARQMWAPYLLDEPIIEPAPPGAEPPAGSPEPYVPAAQKPRAETRTAQQIEVAVRAIRAAQPGLSQRQVAAIAGTSPSNAGRILREGRDAAPAHSVPAAADEPELVSAAS